MSGRPKADPALSPIIEMADVWRRIDGSDVITGVDWTIGARERWVVLGPNGSGKTTLARMAALRLHPTRGTLRVLDVELGRGDIRPLLSRVGYASASLAEQLRPDLVAADVVMTARHGALEPWWHDYDDADREAALVALDRAGVAALAGQRFGTCSSGEKQRVLIARALMTDPDLVVLDEPTAALDLGGREQFVATLERLATEDTPPATVLITHHVDEIPPSFTHALLMHAGSVAAAGPIHEVLDAKALSEIFGLELELERRAGRWSARAVDRP